MKKYKVSSNAASGTGQDSAPGEITELLQRSADGDTGARDAIWELTQTELKRLANARLSAESGNPTWQPTELVNEVWLKLSDLQMDLNNRAHFMAMAATAMRRVLIDHARMRRRDKRGKGVSAITLSTNLAGEEKVLMIDILDLDRALNDLAELDERKARIVDLSYFGGLNNQEIAEMLGVSDTTVKRDLRSARAWLVTTLRVS